MGAIGTTWIYSSRDFFGGPIMPNLVESVGDTVVNGQNCRMLKSETHVCNSLHDWGKVYFVYEEVGRVYAYNFYKKEFVVWYDFNAEKGDEWALLISYG
jgi:hypothetical protein